MSERPWWAWGCSAQLTPRDLANLRRFNVWLLAFAATFLLASVLLKSWAAILGPAAYAVAVLPSLLLLLAVHSYIEFLRQADELTRKIQLEALGLGFAAGALFMVAYPLLERAGAPELDLSDPLMVMVLTWVLAVWLGQRRYA